MRTEIIRHALGEGAGDGADSQTVAAATIRALTSLLAQVKPLVGELAWSALYVRSLHLARSSFTRPDTFTPASPGDLMAPLREDLLSRAPAGAQAAAQALLLAFADLLVSLIGEPLTHRLLRKAWGSPAADEHPQEKPQ